jgi:hypothetical protein
MVTMVFSVMLLSPRSIETSGMGMVRDCNIPLSAHYNDPL